MPGSSPRLPPAPAVVVHGAYRWAPAALLAVLVLGVPRSAIAEPSTADRAIAERLFDRGRRQMGEGALQAACESFAESQRLDPGTGTLLNLANCYEASGKLASAWVEFREALAASRREKRSDRVRYALDHLAAIEPRLAYLTVSVVDRPPGETPSITLDGRALGPAAWGVAIPVDAGRHEALVEGRRWRATIDIRDGEHRQIEVPAHLEPVPASGAASPERPPRVSAQSTQGPADESWLAAQAAHPEPAGRDRRARVVELALGGAGLAGVGVGIYFGWRASDLWSQRNRACPMEACTIEGARLGSRADAAATVATWTMVGGIGALGAAALVFLWPRSASPRSAQVSTPVWQRLLAGVRLDGPGRLTMGGSF